MKSDSLGTEWDLFDHEVQLHSVFAEMEPKSGNHLPRITELRTASYLHNRHFLLHPHEQNPDFIGDDYLHSF